MGLDGSGWSRTGSVAVRAGPPRRGDATALPTSISKRPKQLRIGRKTALGSGRRVRRKWNELHHVAVGPCRPRAPQDATSLPASLKERCKKGKFRCKTRWRAAVGLHLERMTLGRVRGGPGRASAPQGRKGLAHFDQQKAKHLRIGRTIALGSGRRVRWE